MRVIYDIGANNGDDIPYYLMRADKVVSVEANPVLCEGIRSRFADEISSGNLVVENVVISNQSSEGDVSFYIHNESHVLSQFPTPKDLSQFTSVLLPSKSIIDLIGQHGEPWYVKIDVEHFDVQLLESLFDNGIRPPFISAESHRVDVFACLVSKGQYRAFKLVDGFSVSRVYRNEALIFGTTTVRYSFPHHSAGPFGDDIHGNWIDADKFFRQLAVEGLGWKDIHASNIRETDSTVGGGLSELLWRKLLKYLARFPDRLWRRP